VLRSTPHCSQVWNDVAFPYRQKYQRDSSYGANRQRHNRCLSAEASAGQPIRPDHSGPQKTFARATRNGDRKDPALREVPGNVDVYAKPQTPREHVSGGQEHAALNTNRRGIQERRSRIKKMQRPKNGRRNAKRNPTPQPLLQDPKNDASKHDFFEDAREYAHG
jgi:hypothetical protein